MTDDRGTGTADWETQGAPLSVTPPNARPRYDAFIAYKRGLDDDVIGPVQKGLHRLARPAFKLRAIRTFRDRTSMGSTSDWQAYVDQALLDSAHLVVLMCPESLASAHVRHEIEHFVNRGDAASIHLAVTDTGKGIHLSDVWSAPWVPPYVKRISEAPPNLVDLTFVRTSPNQTLRNARFRNSVLDLASAIRGIDKDLLDGEDVRRRRRMRVVIITAVLLLALLAIAAVFGWVNADVARRQAEARSVAALSLSLADERPDLALLLAAEAQEQAASLDTLDTLRSVVYGRSEITRFLRGHEDLLQVAIDPTGEWLATADATGNALVRDVQSGAITATLEVGDAGFAALGADTEGRYVVGGMRDGFARWWDARTGLLVGESEWRHNDAVTALAFSEDGTAVVTGARDGTVGMWDLTDGTAAAIPLQPPGDQILALGVDLAQAKIYSVDESGVVTTWESGTTLKVQESFQTRSHAERTNQAPVTAAALSVPGGRVAVGGYDNTISLWDLESGEQVGGLLTAHRSFVSALGYDTSGAILLSGGGDSALVVWDATSGVLRAGPFLGHYDQLSSLAFGPEASIVSADATGVAIQWDLDSLGTLPERLPVGTDDLIEEPRIPGTEELIAFSSLAVAADETALVVGTGHGVVFVVDPMTGRDLMNPIEIDDAAVSAVAVDADGSRFVAGSTGGVVSVVEMPSGTVVASWTSDAPATGVDIDAQGTTVVIGDGAGNVLMWNLEEAGPVVLTTYPQPVVDVAVDASGKRVVSAARSLEPQPEVTVDRDELAHHVTLEGTSTDTVAVDPAGAVAAYQDLTGALVFIDVDTGEQFGEPTTQIQGTIVGLDFDHDGTYLAAATSTGEIHVFHVETRRRIGVPLTVDGDVAADVSVADAGSALFTNDVESIVRWPLDTDRLTDAACEVAGRDLADSELSQYLRTDEPALTCESTSSTPR